MRSYSQDDPTTLGLDNNAIAYGWYMAIVFIIAAGLVLAVTAPMTNGFVDYSNSRIADGAMSAQTKAAVDWNIQAFIWLPTFALIGILLWSIVRPLEQKRLGR